MGEGCPRGLGSRVWVGGWVVGKARLITGRTRPPLPWLVAGPKKLKESKRTTPHSIKIHEHKVINGAEIDYGSIFEMQDVSVVL